MNFIFFDDSKNILSNPRVENHGLVHLISREPKLSGDEIETFGKEDVSDSAWDQRKTYLRVNLKQEIQLQTVF